MSAYGECIQCILLYVEWQCKMLLLNYKIKQTLFYKGVINYEKKHYFILFSCSYVSALKKSNT